MNYFINYMIFVCFVVNSVYCTEFTTLDIIRRLALETHQEWSRETFNADQFCGDLSRLQDITVKWEHGGSRLKDTVNIRLEMSDIGESISPMRQMLLDYVNRDAEVSAGDRDSFLRDLFACCICSLSSRVSSEAHVTSQCIDSFSSFRTSSRNDSRIFTFEIAATPRDMAAAFPSAQARECNVRSVEVRETDRLISQPCIKQQPIESK